MLTDHGGAIRCTMLENPPAPMHDVSLWVPTRELVAAAHADVADVADA
jgi:hypothetical protein